MKKSKLSITLVTGFIAAINNTSYWLHCCYGIICL